MSKRPIDYKLAYMQHLFDKLKNKKTESYVIHRIWDRLDDERILFKTQQKVKRLEGGYALTDLYLPQLELFIEVNEPYHELQSEADKQRNDDIVDITNHTLKVIQCGDNKEGGIEWQPLAEIHRQIDDCVAFIKQRISEKEQDGSLKPWNMSQWLDVDYHKEKGVLRADDEDALSTIEDICELFGTESTKTRRGIAMAPIPGRDDIALWFPREHNSGHWKNEVLDQGDTFVESNEKHPKIKVTDTRQRVTFFKSKDALGMDVYRFLGVYELDIDETLKQQKYVRRRIATEYKL